MASPEQLIRLDTGAFASARAVRLTRALGYWVLLVAAVTAIGTLFAFAARAIQHGASAKPSRVAAKPVAGPSSARAATPVAPPAPPVERLPQLPAARTPVTVWNGFGGKGAASATASRVQAAGYPLATVGNAPRAGFSQTVIYYSGPAYDAAWSLARKLGYPPHEVVRPLDGLTPKQIRPARIVVVLGR